MKGLNIESTKTTPAVSANFEEKILEIKGNSYPEDSPEFYKHIYDWIDEAFDQGIKELSVNFFIEYFNTSSSKCFLILLEILLEKKEAGNKVKVNWMYNTTDDDMLESGQELLLGLDIEHSFIPVDAA